MNSLSDSADGMSLPLRFLRWELPAGVSLAALLPSSMSRCGIYVLEFSDGELYVGQTVSLLSRIASHYRKWPNDIVAVRFSATRRENLDQAERDVVAQLVAAGSRLRNIDLLALPLRSEALDMVVDPAVQAEWLAGESGALAIGDRGQIAQQRRKTRPRYRKLSKHSEYQHVLAALTAYIRECVPWPHLTEGRFWSVTSLPSTGRTSDWRRLAAVSINNVEVLVLGEALEEQSEGWKPEGFLNVALDTRLEDSGDFKTYRSEYRPTGQVLNIPFHRFGTVPEMLANPRISGPARELSMGLLRKGPGMFGRFHDYNLSDDVFVALSAHALSSTGAQPASSSP